MTTTLDPTFPRPGTPEWGVMNQRRAELIMKSVRGTLTDAETVEYEYLQTQSAAAVEKAFPQMVFPPRLQEILDQSEGME